MKPVILPNTYFSPQVFESEQLQLFQESWIFAGLTSDLGRHNDYVTVKMGNTPVVIQNFNGELKAFTNVCTHRFSILQVEPRGNRPLVCPYHGWHFDCNGNPIGIPKKPHFGDLDAQTLASLTLSEWKLDVVGKFVFISGQNQPQTLLEFLGDTASFLVSVSTAIGSEIDCNPLSLDCNWKVAVENTLESYHVSAVHAKTFLKLGTSGEQFGFEGPHSNWTTGVNEKTWELWQKIAHLYQSRPFKIDGYFHQFIFPNLTIATTFGNSFSIQRFDPESPDTTAFTSWVYSSQLSDLRKVEQVMVNAMETSIVNFNREVFSEDKVVCAHVQNGLKHAKTEGLLSDIEDRVLAFQRAYQKVMVKPNVRA